MNCLISINYKWLLSVDQAFCESFTCSKVRSIRIHGGGTQSTILPVGSWELSSLQQ